MTHPALGLIARATEDPAGAKLWLDGPKLAAWIEERRPGGMGNGWDDSRRRTLRAWRAGRKATVDAADRMLVHLGLMLNELPDGVWTGPPKRHHGRGYPVEVHQAAAQAYADGASLHEIARRFGTTTRSVRAWVGRDPGRPGTTENSQVPKSAAGN